MNPRQVIVATRSAGKLRELRPLLEGAGYWPLDLAEASLPELPEEQGIECFDTFEENALAKARYFFERARGLPVLADDSGLEVDGLGARPGVHSKRWSGRSDLEGQALDDANNAKLLASLGEGVDRRARYVCVAAFVDERGSVQRRGEVRGAILSRPRGAGGFGYDPYFFSDELGRTFGEASIAEKEGVSHRARAFRALLAALAGRG